MNSIIPTTTTAGLIEGTRIVHRILILPAPSMEAASSSSFGIVIRNCRIRKMLKKPPPVKNGKINGQYVSPSPIPFVQKIYRGIKVTIPGRRIVPTQMLKISFFPRKRSLAKAYPQKIAVMVPKVTAGMIMVNVFLK